MRDLGIIHQLGHPQYDDADLDITVIFPSEQLLVARVQEGVLAADGELFSFIGYNTGPERFEPHRGRRHRPRAVAEEERADLARCSPRLDLSAISPVGPIQRAIASEAFRPFRSPWRRMS